MVNKILLRHDYLKLGICQYIDWLPEKAPHIIVCGATGSGKTYFTKLLLGKITLFEPTAQIYICDFKGDRDFEFLNGCNHFYRFIKCQDGLQDFYNRFQQRQNGEDKSQNMIVLFFDEWAAYCNSLDKKVIEIEKQKLSNLLMLGRSFKVHIIIAQQRADAQYFGTARDNFNIAIGLGNLSEESKNMLFHEFKNQMNPDRTQGTGYMLTNGAEITSVVVPAITDMNKLHHVIKQGIER